MRRTILASGLLAAVLAVVLAGCGGTTTRTVTRTLVRTITTAPSGCPSGVAFMGCAAGAAARPSAPPPGVRVTRPIRGCVFPDVSSWQGHPGWDAASGHICAAVAKAGESGFEDPDYAFNLAAFRRLRIPHGAYWFIRGCDDGTAFARVLLASGFASDRLALRPVLDMEVSSARGCAPALASTVHRLTGVWPIIYTSPGLASSTVGGSADGLPVWEADYGSVLGRLPFPALVVGWQRYAPPYTYMFVPGLGYQDESLNMGYATMLAHPAPPKPKPRLVCFGKHATHARGCKPIVALYARREGALVATRYAEDRLYGGLDVHRCSKPYRRIVCKELGRGIRALDRRDRWFLARVNATYRAYS